MGHTDSNCTPARITEKSFCVYHEISGGSRNVGRAEDNVSVSSSFIVNEHNEPYAFYTGKDGILKKLWGQLGKEAAAHTPPHLNPQLHEMTYRACSKDAHCTLTSNKQTDQKLKSN